MEHVAGKAGSFQLKIQNMFTPAWKFVAGNCHLNNNARNTLQEAGFASVRITDFSFPTRMCVFRPWIFGVATK